jgi:hypothetical protein
MRRRTTPQIQMIPKNQITGSLCAWRGCDASFKGEMPPRWMYLAHLLGPAAETPPRFSPRPDALGRRLVPGAQPGPRSVAEASRRRRSRGHCLVRRESPSLTPSPPRIQTLRGILAKFLPEPPREALRARR